MCCRQLKNLTASLRRLGVCSARTPPGASLFLVALFSVVLTHCRAAPKRHSAADNLWLSHVHQ